MKNPSKTVRYGIIGFGRFAEMVIAPAVRGAAHSALVALQKRSLAEAREKARVHSIPLSFDSVQELAAHPDVDAVFIVSANSCHCTETIAAAENGKHVIVEKPIAMNAVEAQLMIDTCEQHRVKLMVGHMVRLSPLIVRLRDLVQSGSLGRVTVARADYVYDGRLSHRPWLYDREVAGGGPVFDVGVHCLDTLRFVLQDEVASVKSEMYPLPTEKRTEASAQLLLRFSRGTIGSIYCSFEAPIRKSFIEITGTEGVASSADFTISGAPTVLTVTRGRKDLPSEGVTEEFQVPNLYRDEISHFTECILNDSEPSLSGLNGLRNQQVLDEAMKAPP
jgi:predicted dehydrogenase